MWKTSEIEIIKIVRQVFWLTIDILSKFVLTENIILLKGFFLFQRVVQLFFERVYLGFVYAYVDF